jgi:hypothetical protein
MGKIWRVISEPGSYNHATQMHPTDSGGSRMSAWRLWHAAFCLVFLFIPASPGLLAQEPDKATDVSSPSVTASPPDQVSHRFWDRENAWLFAGVGAARALDYTSTLNMRRRGRQEILLTNSVVDNHPLFAGIEAGGVALSVGASYLFHATGHHRLERWVSIVHISVAGAGAVRNYSLQTAHPAPTAVP